MAREGATAEPPSGPAVKTLFDSADSDNAQKPKNEDQHQDAAKTDIHDTLLLLVFGSAGETVGMAATFQSLRERQELPHGIILPCGKMADLLDFPGFTRESAVHSGAG